MQEGSTFGTSYSCPSAEVAAEGDLMNVGAVLIMGRRGWGRGHSARSHAQVLQVDGFGHGLRPGVMSDADTAMMSMVTDFDALKLTRGVTVIGVGREEGLVGGVANLSDGGVAPQKWAGRRGGIETSGAGRPDVHHVGQDRHHLPKDRKITTSQCLSKLDVTTTC